MPGQAPGDRPSVTRDRPTLSGMADPMSRLVADEHQFVYPDPVSGGIATRHLRLWRTTTDGLVAVITERPEDEGASITNAAESAHASVQHTYAADGPVTVVEHYPDPAGGRFDEIVLDENGTVSWRSVPPALLLLSIGVDAYPA